MLDKIGFVIPPITLIFIFITALCFGIRLGGKTTLSLKDIKFIIIWLSILTALLIISSIISFKLQYMNDLFVFASLGILTIIFLIIMIYKLVKIKKKT